MREGKASVMRESSRTAPTASESCVPVKMACDCGLELNIVLTWTTWTCAGCGARKTWWSLAQDYETDPSYLLESQLMAKLEAQIPT